MKKIFPLFICIMIIISLFSFGINSDLSSSALEIGKEARIIASRCDVYEEADFSSNKVTIIVNEQEQLYRLKHSEIVTVLLIEGDFAKIKSSEEKEGYVYKYYLTQNDSQSVYPVFNGTIRNNTIIYDMDFENSGFSAKAGDRVFIFKSYNEKENYTAIQIVLDDQSLYNGYVLTKDVNPDGISGLLIAGISIIAAAVTIVLSIVFIKKKKKK